VETVAESASDGILAPLLYMAVGGASLGILYKAVNTMDSMVDIKTTGIPILGGPPPEPTTFSTSYPRA
jgi:cobalamin biosynthesis protein CobD/CbiB